MVKIHAPFTVWGRFLGRKGRTKEICDVGPRKGGGGGNLKRRIFGVRHEKKWFWEYTVSKSTYFDDIPTPVKKKKITPEKPTNRVRGGKKRERTGRARLFFVGRFHGPPCAGDSEQASRR